MRNSKKQIMMKVLEVADILRKDNGHYLWNKQVSKFTLFDWIELDSLKNGYAVKKAHGKSQDKQVMRISDGKIYFNGKACYEENNIKRCTFYGMMNGQYPKRHNDFKYIINEN